jgi:hypothetical protein
VPFTNRCQHEAHRHIIQNAGDKSTVYRLEIALSWFLHLNGNIFGFEKFFAAYFYSTGHEDFTGKMRTMHIISSDSSEFIYLSRPIYKYEIGLTQTILATEFNLTAQELIRTSKMISSLHI